MINISKEFGCTSEEAAEAIYKLVTSVPDSIEYDIELIKHNPQLSFFQKIKLIRFMRKTEKISRNKSK